MPRTEQSVRFLFLLLTFLLAACHHGGVKESNTGTLEQPPGLREIEARVQSRPNDPAVYMERARYYVSEHSLDKAIVDIRKAISLDEKNAGYFVFLSEVYLLNGDPKESSDALLHANTLSPGDNQILLKLANLNLIMKDYAKTFEYVNKAFAVSSVNPQAWFIQAIAFLEKGDTARAVDDLMKAVDQDQKYFDAYMELGDLYALKNDPRTASYFEDATKARPSSREAWYRLGMYYQDNGKYEKAISTYEKLMTVDTTFRNAPYNMGYIYLVYLHDYPAAIRYFGQAIRRDSGYFEAWYNRGYAYELSGDIQAAYKDYHRTLEIKVNFPKAVEGLNRLDARRAGKQ